MDVDYEEEFDSPLLLVMSAGAMLTTFGTVLFGQLNALLSQSYNIFLIAMVVFSFLLYSTILSKDGWDFRERVEGFRFIGGFGAGLAIVIVLSIVISGAIGRPTAAIWVPLSFVSALSTNPSVLATTTSTVASVTTGQLVLSLAILFFLVSPAERALVAMGAIFTKITGLGADQPLALQPFMHGTTFLWALLHVSFGQYPPWFFFVVYPSGIGMLGASDIANDYTAAVLTHGTFDVLVRLAVFLTTGT
jgi:hypothetical protein